jgi:hypothetical protein
MRKRRLRLAAVSTLTLGLLALAVHCSHGQKGFATPSDCLNAYYEACQDGNVPMYLSCLADPLCLELHQNFGDSEKAAIMLRQKAVKNWVVVAKPASKPDVSSIVVDEVWADSIKRVRFQLGFTGSSWLIVAIDPLQDKQPPIRFGTDVRNVPDEPPAIGQPPGEENTPQATQ